MIIDAHVHVGVSTAYNFAATADDLLRLADENGIDRIFVTDFTALVHDMREGNDTLGKAVRRHPDRILGYVSIPTMNFDNGALEEIDRCVHEYGMRGIKIYSYAMTPLVRPSVFPVMERAASHRMPILAHSTAEECEVMAAQVPEAFLMMAHSGNTALARGDWLRAVQAAERHPSLLLETASSTVNNGSLEYTIERIGAERIIFGTDMPLLDVSVQMARVSGAAISQADKDLIFGGNMARLLAFGA